MAYHCVYKVVNKTLKEVYFGVSRDPRARVNDYHRLGKTKTIEHWCWSSHDIYWRTVSRHRTQERASEEAHWHERNTFRRGYENLLTGGI